MNFADTSFLCALYREQDNSPLADQYMSRSEDVIVSELVLWEFRQSTRLQVSLFRNDRTKGIPQSEADEMLRKLEANLAASAFEVARIDWVEVLKEAEKISAQHTISGGYRAMDILHVATALQLNIGHFLTFDKKQRKLVEATIMRVPL
jgi:predicted nucleic acid-binding protein